MEKEWERLNKCHPPISLSQWNLIFFLFAAASSAPLISMNLQQDVQLNDMNTSAAITSYYTTNEATTTNPLKPNTIIR